MPPRPLRVQSLFFFSGFVFFRQATQTHTSIPVYFFFQIHTFFPILWAHYTHHARFDFLALLSRSLRYCLVSSRCSPVSSSYCLVCSHWTIEWGDWIVARRNWTVARGDWTVGWGKWTVARGKWKVARGTGQQR